MIEYASQLDWKQWVLIAIAGNWVNVMTTMILEYLDDQLDIQKAYLWVRILGLVPFSYPIIVAFIFFVALPIGILIKNVMRR